MGELRIEGSRVVRADEDITEVVIPDWVTEIGDSAFHSCRNLRSVVIPDGVTGIGSQAFDMCYNLQSVTIPDSVTLIGYEAFKHCESLQSVSIPASVTVMGDGVFANCKNLESIYVAWQKGHRPPDWDKKWVNGCFPEDLPSRLFGISAKIIYDSY